MTGLENDLLQIIQKNFGEVAVNHLHDYIGNTEKLKVQLEELEKKNKALTETIFEQETEIEKLKGLGLLEEDLNQRSRELDNRTSKLEMSELQIKLTEANKRADAIESLTRKIIHGNDSHGS